MRSTLFKLWALLLFPLISLAAFGQCAVQPCISIDKQIQGSKWPASADDSGIANAYAVTGIPLAPVLRAYSVIIFKAAHANTGASTLTVNGGSAIPIKKSGTTALTGGEIAAGQDVLVIYDGTNFQLGSGSATGSSGTTSHTCIVTIGDPNSASPSLQTGNYSPAQCGNNFGTDQTVTGVSVWVDAGASVFQPILTGGTGTSIATGNIAGSAAAWVSGTVNGSPVIHSFAADASTCSSTPCTIDVNINSVDGITRYAVIQIVTVGAGGNGSTVVGTGAANNHEILYDNATAVSGITNASSVSKVLKSNGASSTPSFQFLDFSDLTGSFAFSGLTGSVACSQMPAGTGDVTWSAGSCATTLATVTVPKGGTGQTSLTAHNFVLGEGASAAAFLSLGAHQIPVGATSADPSAKTVPDCTDTGGNHLNFTQSTDAFSCGTSSSGGGGGGLPTAESHTASTSASLAFTTCISNTYTHYVITVNQLVPSTNGVSINWNASTNGGSSYDTTSGHYGYSTFRFIPAGSAAGGSDSTTAIGIDGGAGTDFPTNTASNGGINGTFDLWNPGSSTEKKSLNGRVSMFNTANHYEGSTVSGAYTQTTAVNAFEIIAASGNLASGTVICQPLPY